MVNWLRGMDCSWMTGLGDKEQIQCRFESLLFPVMIFHLADVEIIKLLIYQEHIRTIRFLFVSSLTINAFVGKPIEKYFLCVMFCFINAG